MANNGGNITFGIGFNVDKSGLNDLRKSLQDIQKATTKDLVGNLGSDEAKKALDEVKRSASEIEQALKKAYNPTINSVNVSKFNQLLAKTGTSLNTVYQSFSKVQGGSSAFRNLTTLLLTTNMQLKETHSLLDSMGQTMVNTVRWGIASSVMNTFTSSVQNAYNYVKVLDSSLTDIRIVTGQSRELMDRFADSANKAAQNLGRQTKDYTNAALSFYQQGLSDDEVAARTETTLKAANITGAGVSDMANQLTAVWNGFQVSMEDTENIVSKLAAVADSSASNMSELATAMSKTASVANNMGVDVDQLTAQVSTIIATTRQAPETVGNALKTIYARINDIKAGSDEAEISLGNYTGKMAGLGVQVLDQQGHLRDTGLVMEEIGERWGTMTREQQIYLAQTMAGQRQMNNLIALFDNWDMYTKELNTSLEAQGTLDEKNARYMESLATHVNQLTAASEGLIQAFANGDSFKGFIDVGTDVLQLLTNIVESVGGGGTAILGLGSILTRVFSKQISSEISSLVLNFQAMRENAQSLAAQKEITNLFQGINLNNGLTEQLVKWKEHALDFGNAVTTQLHEILNSLLKERNELANQQQAWDDNKKAALDFYKANTNGKDIGNLENSDQSFRKVLNNLQNIQRAAHSAAAEMNTFSESISKEGFDKDVNAEMQYYINTLRDLRNSNKLSTESQNILSESLVNYQKVLAKVKALGLSGKDLLNNKLIKLAASELISNLANMETLIELGAQRTAETVRQASSGVAQQIKNDTTTCEGRIEDLLKNIDTRAAVQNFVNLASSVGQFASAISALTNLSKTLQDETLTPGEKILQLISNLGMSLPMLISSVRNGAEAIRGLGIAFKIAGVEGATLLTGLKLTLAAFAPYAAVIAAVGVAVYALTKAYNANSDAAKEAQKTALSLQSQYKDLKSSYEELKESIEDYQESKNALSKLEEGTVSWKEQVKELNQQVLDLVKKYPELAKYVSNVNGQLTIAEDKLQEFQDAQAAAMEQARRNSLLGNVAANRADIINQETQAGRRITYYNDGPSTVSQKTIEAVVNGINKNSGFLNEKVLDDLGIANQDLREALLDNREPLQKLAADVLANTQATELLTQQYIQSANAGNEVYDNSKYQSSLDALIQLQAESNLNTYLSRYNSMTDANIQRLYVSRNSNLSGSKNKFGGVGEYYDLQGNASTLTDDFIRQELAFQDAIAEAQGFLSQYDETLNTLAEAGNKIHDNLGDIAAAAVQAKDSNDLIDLSKYTEEELQNIQESLTSGVFSNLWSEAGLENGEVYGLALQNSINTTLDLIKNRVEDFEAAAPSNIGGFRENFEKFQKGTLKNADLEEFEATLDSLEDAYPNLIDKVETLRNNWLAGTAEYEAALSAIEDTLSYNMIDASMLASKAAIEAWNDVFHEQKEFAESGQIVIDPEVDLTLDDDEVAEFEDQLNAILNAEHSIDIEIHTDAEEAFEGIESKFDQISKAAAKIGLGFIVAADDMRELNNVFPGIMENMQLLENGTYQLNENIVKSATNAAMSEAAAEAESVRQRLQSQATLLHAKAQAYQNIANAAAQLASSEVRSSEESAQLQKNISDELRNLKQINSDLAATKENADQKAVADSSQVNASITALNWAGAANSAAQSIYAFAANAAHNMQAVASGHPEDVIPPGEIFASFGSGKSGQDVLLSAIESAESTINAGDATKLAFADMAAQFQAMADASEQAANDIDGMLAQIGGNVNDITTGIQDVQAGKAYGSTQKGDKSKKSGSKKSGSSKDKTKSADLIDKKKLKDSLIDRYHEIDRAIKEVELSIKDLDKAEKKTIRNGLSKTIDNEVLALEHQKKLYEQKLDLMQADLKVQQAELEALGVQFDEQGNIINYTALMIEYQKLYNQLLEDAKALTGDEQLAKLKEAEGVKTRLDNLKSQMNAYEQLQDKIVDAGNAILDILDKEEELRIQQFKIKIDWLLDKALAERDWNDFREKVIDQIKKDDYLGQARTRLRDFNSYYKEDGGGIIQELTDHVNRTRQEAQIIENGGTSSIYGQNEAQALEDLKHYNDELMLALRDVEDLALEIHDLYLDTIDKAQDAFDQQIDAYEQVDSIIEHDMNLLQMLHPLDNEEQLARYYQLRAENNNQEVDFFRRQKLMWKELMDAAQEGTDEWKKFRDNWMESVSSLNDAVDKAVENLLDKYQNTISKIIKNAKNDILGGDWQKALDEWDYKKWVDDRYLDMLSRATKVLDFTDNVNKAMQGLPVNQQQQLLKLMDAEVTRLNNLTRVRQIDVDIANKKLEVLQKQMALELAQLAKTRLRLRRDSQGNYTYQYVADESEINTKQQELRDSIEELRILVKEDISDNIDAVQDKLQEFFDKAQELSLKYYDDQETLQEELYELADQYFGAEGYLSYLGIDYNNMQSQLLEATGAEFANLLGEFGINLSNFYDGTKEGLAALLDNNGEKLREALNDSSTKFKGTLSDATGTFADFLGLNLDKFNSTDDQIWQSILQLVGESGKIPSLLDIFTTGVIQLNFNKMNEENQNLLFGPTGLNPSWDTAIGNATEDIGRMAQAHEDAMDDMEDATNNMANRFGDAAWFMGSIVGSVVLPMLEGMIGATEEYGGDLQALEQVAGYTFNDIANGIDYTIGETQGLIQNNAALISTYENEVYAIQAVVQELNNLIDKYDGARQAAIAAAEAAYQFWAAAQGRLANVQLPNYSSGRGTATASSTPVSSSSGGGSSGSSSGSGGSGGSSSSGKPLYAEYVVYNAKTGLYGDSIYRYDETGKSKASLEAARLNQTTVGSYGNLSGGSYKDNWQVRVRELEDKGDGTYRGGKLVSGRANLSKYIAPFATGGYTGEWADGDNSPRLALLHQKELVLNADDTKNILSAVDLVRGIMNSVSGLNGVMQSDLPGVGRFSNLTNNNNGMSQSVIINADFPAVSDAQEIKQAFNNLINIASQKASGNRRTY